jgi:hypothetical protein
MLPIKFPSAAASKSRLLISAFAASSRHRDAKRRAWSSRSARHNIAVSYMLKFPLSQNFSACSLMTNPSARSALVLGAAECSVAAQRKARQLRRALEGKHEVLRNAKPEYCLPKTQGRQGCEGPGSTSVTVGAGCSITSTATVSTTGVTACFTFRAAFFAGAPLGLAVATVRFTALAALRALLRLAEFAVRNLARLFTFDPFLRLAMIFPLF